MRLVRVHLDGYDEWGAVEQDGVELIRSPADPVRTGRFAALRDVRLLAPAQPLNVVGMAHNTGPDDATLPPQTFLNDLQERNSLWMSAKGSDGWTPLGPWLETDLDPRDIEITLTINGRDLQPGSTGRPGAGLRRHSRLRHLFRDVGVRRRHPHRGPRGVRPDIPGDEVTVSAPGLRALTSTGASAPPADTAGELE